MELVEFVIEHYVELVGDQVQVNKYFAKLYNVKHCEKLKKNPKGDARAFNIALATLNRSLLVRASPDLRPISFLNLKNRLIANGDYIRFKLLGSLVPGFSTKMLDKVIQNNDEASFRALLDHCKENDSPTAEPALEQCYQYAAQAAAKAGHPFLEIVLECAKEHNYNLSWPICMGASSTGNLALINRFSLGIEDRVAFDILPKLILKAAKRRGEEEIYIEKIKNGELRHF